MSEGLHNATYMGEQVTSQEVLLRRRELAASQEQMSLRLAGFDAQMAEASRQFQRLRNDTDHLRIAQAPPPPLPHTPNVRIRPPEKFTPPGMNISTWLYSASAMAARVSSQQQVYTPTSSTPISLRHPIPSGTVMPTGFAPSFPPVAEPMDLSAMDVKEVKCHRCHKLGHYARMCKAATPHPDNKA